MRQVEVQVYQLGMLLAHAHVHAWVFELVQALVLVQVQQVQVLQVLPLLLPLVP